jgi:hypothetical protein
MYLQHLTWLRETAKHPQRRLRRRNRGLERWVAFFDVLTELDDVEDEGIPPT